MKKLILLISFISPVFFYFVNAQTWENLTYSDTAYRLHENPVRGLIPAYGNPEDRIFPHSMEFYYIGLRNTMINIDNFDWTQLENKLEEISDRGNTAVVRFFMDYPGNQIETPQFLIDAGITMNEYTDYGNDPGESKSPDYNDPITMSALINFIENFGLIYDGDPRISVIQAGLVGFWGEWHTYPLNISMNDANRKIIFEAYANSFPNTELNFRGPQSNADSTIQMTVGYHDDSYLSTTISTESWAGWFFWNRILSANVSQFWKNAPMGGEIYPGLQGNLWNAVPNIPESGSQDFETCLDSTHATYMMIWSLWEEPIGSIKYTNGLIQNKHFGYQFNVNGVKLNPYQNNEINFDVRIENRGIAPFYYNWDVEFTLLKNGIYTNLGTTDWNINTIQPNDIAERNYAVNHTLENGSYKILMRFVNPLTVLKPNAKQLSFANAEQNADSTGWITLKSFEYSNLGIVDEFENETIVLFPNPSSEDFEITSVEDILEISIVDVSGSFSKFVTPEQKTKKLFFKGTDFPKGIYFIEIKSDQKTQKIKFIKI